MGTTCTSEPWAEAKWPCFDLQSFSWGSRSLTCTCRGTCGPPGWPWSPWCWWSPYWGKDTFYKLPFHSFEHIVLLSYEWGPQAHTTMGLLMMEAVLASILKAEAILLNLGDRGCICLNWYWRISYISWYVHGAWCNRNSVPPLKWQKERRQLATCRPVGSARLRRLRRR